MGRLEDPQGMVFNHAGLGYDEEEIFLPSMAYISWYTLKESLVKYYDEIWVSKRYAKWVVYLHDQGWSACVQLGTHS